MPHDLLRNGDGRFWRGNLHCHSSRSDGQREPERVAAAYQEAGYDFIALSDHFEERYGWSITDTRALRTRDFSTLIAAELSSGPWEEPRTYWVSAVGLPTELDPPPAADPAEVIRRVHGGGAFVVLLHPALNHLPVQASGHLPAFHAVDAVEIYNHSTFGSAPDRADGAYMVDGLLDRGRHVMLTAGDDAHFAFPADRFGGWIEVWAEELDPVALLASLRAGAYYSTQGPRLERLQRDGDRLEAATSAVQAIAVGGPGDRMAGRHDLAGRERRAGQPRDLRPLRVQGLVLPRHRDRRRRSARVEQPDLALARGQVR
jgi:hypothetical protein